MYFVFATSKVHDVHFKNTSQRLKNCDFFCFETIINNIVFALFVSVVLPIPYK